MSTLILFELALLTRVTGATLAAVALTRSIDTVAAVTTRVQCTIVDILVAVLALVTGIADTVKSIFAILASAIVPTWRDGRVTLVNIFLTTWPGPALCAVACRLVVGALVALAGVSARVALARVDLLVALLANVPLVTGACHAPSIGR